VIKRGDNIHWRAVCPDTSDKSESGLTVYIHATVQSSKVQSGGLKTSESEVFKKDVKKGKLEKETRL